MSPRPITIVSISSRNRPCSTTPGIAAIAASRTYQTSSKPNDTNERDDRNFSRALFKRPDAEVLLDNVSVSAGVIPSGAGRVTTFSVALTDVGDARQHTPSRPVDRRDTLGGSETDE